MRLVDGGKPEVFYNNRWRPICGHYFWDNNNGADLFCQQLNQGYLSGTINKGTVAEYYLDSDALQIGRCRNGDRWLNCYGGCNSLQVGGLCTGKLVVHLHKIILNSENACCAMCSAQKTGTGTQNKKKSNVMITFLHHPIYLNE